MLNDRDCKDLVVVNYSSVYPSDQRVLVQEILQESDEKAEDD